MVFDTDQVGMADRFDAGDSTTTGCQGTYRNASDVATGLDYSGTAASPCDATAQLGWVGSNPGANPGEFRTLTFAFQPGRFFNFARLEFDCDTDGGVGVNGGAMDGLVVTATLANGGVHPITRERAIGGELIPSVLSVMATCGMYDYAGEWLYEVGIPAKSGVSGGVLAVLPGQLGIGVFSPLLDARGNSVRGVAACRQLSRDFDLHFLRVPRPARSTPPAPLLTAPSITANSI